MTTGSDPDLGRVCEIIIFGGTGDLALRKLIPALYFLELDRRLPADTRIIGVSRREMKSDAYRKLVAERAREHLPTQDFREDEWKRFLKKFSFCRVDAEVAADYRGLSRHLGPAGDGVRVFYLATLPELYAEICQYMDDAGLVNAETRVVLEKPLGHDLQSALAINEAVGQVFGEDQVFRIDHYLGKETVQNLMALRFGNAIFEPLWRAAHIDYVEISVTETIGVEDRGDYYDSSGAMRDMVQNHLLQLLCLTAMEPPVRFEQHAVRNEKMKVLQALRPIRGEAVKTRTVRGQYTASVVSGREVPAYYFEEGVAPESNTETFVALRLEVDSWRWSGTPFYLRTGKRLARRFSEIVVHFKPVAHQIFDPDGGVHAGNRLVIQLQPEEGIELMLNTKIPGKGMALRPVPLDLNLAHAFKRRRWDAYERLLLDVLRGDSTLFMRKDEIETAWAWIDPIIEGWQAHYQQPKLYKAGTMGPDRANELIERDGFRWHENLVQ